MEEKNNNKKSLVWTLILLVILIVLAIVYFKNLNLNSAPQSELNGGQISDEKLSNLTSGKDIDTELLNKSETTPKNVITLDDKEKSEIREYEIKFEKGSFNPKELIVASGGRIQIMFTSVDAEFDVLFPAPFGAYLKVEKGKSQVVGMDVPAERKGQYVFSCRDVCPNEKKAMGVLVIK